MLPSNTAVNFPAGRNGVAGLLLSTNSQRFGMTMTSETFPSADVNFTAKPLVSVARQVAMNEDSANVTAIKAGRGVLTALWNAHQRSGAVRTPRPTQIT